MSRKTYGSKSITGKLRVYRYLKNSGKFSDALPRTVPFTFHNLYKTIRRYSALYIKPDVGSQGIGIYKVKKTSGGLLLRSAKRRKYFASVKKLYRYIRSRSNKRFIIQQGIELEKVAGKPYDIRVMIQRKPKGKWTCTGIFAKVGKAKQIVTNYYQGGRIVLMDQIFERLQLTPEQSAARLKQLEEISLSVARRLSKKRSGMYEMGIDLAYEAENGRLWILEVNSRHPQFYPLRRIDPPMYRRMRSFAKSIGRRSA